MADQHFASCSLLQATQAATTHAAHDLSDTTGSDPREYQSPNLNADSPQLDCQLNRYILAPPSTIYSQIIPLPGTFVGDILEWPIPHVDGFYPAPTFNQNPPTFLDDTCIDFDIQRYRLFLQEALPSAVNLCDGLQNASNAGLQSIQSSSDTAYRLPLWSANLLLDYKSFIDKRSRWQKSLDWLNMVDSEDQSCTQLVQECRRTMNSLPYNTLLPGFSKNILPTAETLATFLSSDWTDDEMINAGVEYILHHLGAGNKRQIANCFFIPYLFSLRARSNLYEPSQRSKLDRLIMADMVQDIFFPLHVNGNHWALIYVDLLNRTVSYADSLSPGALPPQPTIAVLNWWLDSAIPKHSITLPPLQVTAPFFTVPYQRDSHSCGIVILSTMAHLLLNRAQWRADTWQLHRMEWFLQLCNYSYSKDGQVSLNETTTTTPMDVDVSFDDVYNMFDDANEEPFELPASTEESATHNDNLTSEPNLGTTTLASKKRAAQGSDSDDEDYATTSDPDLSEAEQNPLKRARIDDGTKNVRAVSYRKQKAVRDRARKPGYKPLSKNLKRFRSKILADDPHATFKDSDLQAVRCSRCSKWVQMRLLYDLAHWKSHRLTPKCMRNGNSSTPSLFSLGFVALKGAPPVTPSKTTAKVVMAPKPCPGLQRDKYPKVDIYLSRSFMDGGGAPSRSKIALDLFGDVKWGDLSKKQKQMVLRREEVLYRWRNSRVTGCVYSVSCERTVYTPVSDDPDSCSRCRSLLHLHTFQNAINRPLPSDENFRHTPRAYASEELLTLYLKYKGVRDLVELDDGHSPWLKFAKGVASGQYKTQETLLGMVSALVTKAQRVSQGKSLKNMQYSEGFNDFCNILQAISTRAYKTFQHHFGGPQIRSMRRIRARLPRFQAGISDDNMSQLRTVLDRYEYSGPIALAWDDTELQPALSQYQEGEDSFLILGGAAGPIRVQSLVDLDAALEKAKEQKADKLRVWLITVPLPKIPPILVAAVARSGSMDAAALYQLHKEVMDKLYAVDVYPISLSADGSETERSLQRLIHDSAPDYFYYTFPNPQQGCRVELRIPMYQGRPAVNCQDNKHAKKTGRNQLQTGARIIVLSNFFVSYSKLYNMAADPLSPLFKRDVDKVDKQDDRAAARLFSAEMLKFQLCHHSEEKGFTAYALILGELFDAWQSRNIPHRMRIRMALRARFFLMAWRTHVVNHPDYSVNIQFISRESYDIFLTLCDSLLSIIIVYRHFYPTYPLLPWLHSTEPVEHLFGIIRQLKKDFDYADVLYLEPKIRALLLGDFGNLTAEQQARQTSAGYHHTYFKPNNIDLCELSRYPSDKEVAQASRAAFDEVAPILGILGIDAAKMLALYKDPAPVTAGRYNTTSTGPRTVLELLTLYKDVSLFESEEIQTCEMAIAAEKLNSTIAIDSLPDSTDSSLDEVKDSIQSALHQSANSSASPISTPVSAEDAPVASPMVAVSESDGAIPFVNNGNFDIDLIFKLRKDHQSKETSDSIRQLGRVWQPLVSPDQEQSLRQVLHCRLRALVAEQEGKLSSSGAGRQIRYQGAYSVNDSTHGMVRERNKAVAQDVAAQEFVRRRADIFRSFQTIHPHMHCANILDILPLMAGDFVIVLKPQKTSDKSEPQLLVAEVVALYTKANYRGAKHESASEIRSAGAPSYIYVKSYAAFSGAVHTSLSCASLSCDTYLQIPRSHIIFSLKTYEIIKTPIDGAMGFPVHFLSLGSDAATLFDTLQSNVRELNSAVKVLNASKRVLSGPSVSFMLENGGVENGESDGSDGPDDID